MEFVKEYKELAEFAYLLSGPLLLLGLVIGLAQLHFFKKEARDRFNRETILITLNTFEEMVNNITMLQDKLWDMEERSEDPIFTGTIDFFIKDETEKDLVWTTWIESDDGIATFNASTEFLNKIESLSSYIYSGIVDEEFCYTRNGELVINFIEDNKRYIAHARKTVNTSVYEGLIKLYSNWSQKSERNNLILEHKKVAKKLDNLRPPKKVKIVGQ